MLGLLHLIRLLSEPKWDVSYVSSPQVPLVLDVDLSFREGGLGMACS